MDDIIRRLKKAQRVIRELTGLVLEIGTLIGVLKMITENL